MIKVLRSSIKLSTYRILDITEGNRVAYQLMVILSPRKHYSLISPSFSVGVDR